MESNILNTKNVKVLEQYKELVERDPSEISYFWKYASIIIYSVCASSSYFCALSFYTFWYDISGGHCVSWADIRTRPTFTNYLINTSTNQMTVSHIDWTKDIITIYQNDIHCKSFFFVCLLSFFVSVVFLTLFFICGKGGYDTRLFVSPWRIIVPALISSVIMTIMTLIITNIYTYEYVKFFKKIEDIYLTTKSASNVFKYTRFCEIYQALMNTHNFTHYNACYIYWTFKMCKWIMIVSWIAGSTIQSFRIALSADFKLLHVKIFEMPTKNDDTKEILDQLNKHNVQFLTV